MSAVAVRPEITAAGRTHLGCLRPNNEDALLVRADLGLFAVCDGMGGHLHGEVASRLAVDTIAGQLEPLLAAPAADGLDPDRSLGEAVVAAHEAVRAESAARGLATHMGTTAVVALVRGETASIAHVGDSRAYLVSADGRRRLLTSDHTVARLYAQAGLIAEDDVDRHPMRGVLARCLGAPDGCLVDRVRVRFGRGDRLLLCSDGLTGMVGDDEILAITASGRDADSVAAALVAAALAGGGEDNVTVVVLERA